MGAYNEELVKAGVMLAGEGLRPSSKGARVRFDKDGSSTVVDGPFAETKELVAGFWILEVSSREEVIEWVRKAPFRGRRDRDPAGRQRRGLRRRHDPRAARAGGPAARDLGGPARADLMPGPAGVGVGDRTASSTPSGAWSRAKLIGALTRVTGDVGLAEELAQDALVAALERWPETGVPAKPGAWLMATAKHRAIDAFRRAERLRAQDRASSAGSCERGRGAGLGGRARRGGRGRRPAAGLHLLPPGALPRGPRGADPPADRRPDHRRDRPRVPRRRADAWRSGSSAPSGRLTAARVPFEVPTGAGVHRPARLGARGDLPGLQRGLRGDGGGGLGAPGAVPGGAAAGPHPRRADAGGVRGARPGRPHGDPGVAAAAPGSARRASRCCCPTRTAAAGTGC